MRGGEAQTIFAGQQKLNLDSKLSPVRKIIDSYSSPPFGSASTRSSVNEKARRVEPQRWGEISNL